MSAVSSVPSVVIFLRAFARPFFAIFAVKVFSPLGRQSDHPIPSLCCHPEPSEAPSRTLSKDPFTAAAGTNSKGNFHPIAKGCPQEPKENPWL